MKTKTVADAFEFGDIIMPDLKNEAVDIPWYSHPEWKGIFLKNLISSEETSGKFSYHIVKILDNCKVMDHTHEDQWELNFVLMGKGTFILDNVEYPIKQGQVFATPPGYHHDVSARDGDLSLVAVFISL